MENKHKKIKTVHEEHFRGKQISDIILGGQDGLVNVLGVALGVASASNNPTLVMVAGLAATFAETIAMSAVAYTSVKANRDYYYSERNLEMKEVDEMPDHERQEIYDIYKKKGFKGKLLNQIVKVITSNKKVWVDTMMAEELNLSPKFGGSPLKSALVVFLSTLIGSIIPLIPFMFLPVGNAIVASLILSVGVLFMVGVVKAKLTVGNWFKSGLELALIAMMAAVVGYLIGLGLGRIFGTSIAV